ncbi:MAG: hypothetical protein ACRC2T_03305 [Thermoguttaceae bacterium]
MSVSTELMESLNVKLGKTLGKTSTSLAKPNQTAVPIYELLNGKSKAMQYAASWLNEWENLNVLYRQTPPNSEYAIRGTDTINL